LLFLKCDETIVYRLEPVEQRADNEEIAVAMLAGDRLVLDFFGTIRALHCWLFALLSAKRPALLSALHENRSITRSITMTPCVMARQNAMSACSRKRRGHARAGRQQIRRQQIK